MLDFFFVAPFWKITMHKMSGEIRELVLRRGVIKSLWKKVNFLRKLLYYPDKLGMKSTPLFFFEYKKKNVLIRNSILKLISLRNKTIARVRVVEFFSAEENSLRRRFSSRQFERFLINTVWPISIETRSSSEPQTAVISFSAREPCRCIRFHWLRVISSRILFFN